LIIRRPEPQQRQNVRQDGRPESRPDIRQDNGVSWQDDIGADQKRPSRRLKVFSVIGALVFVALGAGLYAVSGWPWQGTAPAVAVTQAPPLTIPPFAAPPPVVAAAPPAASQPALPIPELRAPAPPRPAPLPEPAPPAAAAPPPAAPQQSAVAPPAATAPPRPSAEQLAEARQYVQRAIRILQQTNDIAAARLFLERAAKLGDADALFQLAETYDPAWLARAGARGVSGETSRARALYQQALDAGVAAARERLTALK
jgi:hypothetical protein